MTGPDLINCAFETAGGLGLWVNVLALYRDKKVRGTNIWTAVWFNAWGFWNLWYYPHLGQWASFVGGLVSVSANTVWVALAFWYTRTPKLCERCGGRRWWLETPKRVTDPLHVVNCPSCNSVTRLVKSDT